MSLFFGSQTAKKSIVIVGGDLLIGYFTTLEFLKLKDDGVVSTVRVGYMDEKSELVKDLSQKGVHMMRFDLNDDKSIEKMYDQMECAMIMPPMMAKDMHHSKKLVQMAKHSKDLRHVLFASIMNAHKAKDMDCIKHIYEMEQEFMALAHKSHWETTYLFSISMLMNILFYLRGPIRDREELMWPTKSEKASLVDAMDVAKAIRNLATKSHHHHHHHHSDAATTPGIERFSHFHITGMHAISGEKLAMMCSHALGSKIMLKECSANEMAHYLGDTGEIAKGFIPVLRRIFEMAMKGYFNETHSDLEKLLDKKPVDIEAYFEKYHKDFKPQH
ncbi:hypothetical protein H4219_005476 [Mycoemilia scoparia]|uniref:NmrA-like domain-containing protein n=1 Tax=Mycoemilia scoparia TaxID=417184 RepID=A0A9W7ZXG1_9FUNG|nr:hypothetical protein H4219_005476 [Mycoemilia scoparia]